MRESDPAVNEVDRSSLLSYLELQRVGCETAGSAVYAEVLPAVAADVAAGGPCARILDEVADRPFGDAVVLRFLAGVHALVLDGRAPALAAHYPSAGGIPGPGLAAAVLATVAAHEPELRAAVHAPVQTNEVGRSVALLAGYLELAAAGRPLRILEVGASAGLNLWFDRYRYECPADGDGHGGPATFGPVDAPVRFVDPFVGRHPDLGRPVTVAERRGCDLDPVDPRTPAGRLRLRSLVWPDQPERRARLDAALDAVADRPPVVDRADAVTWLGDHLARPAPAMMTVVVHSIVFQYLPPDDRRAFLRLVDDAAARATDDAPFAWLRTEPGGDRAETRLTVWPGGVPRLVATSGYHGPPVAYVGRAE